MERKKEYMEGEIERGGGLYGGPPRFITDRHHCIWMQRWPSDSLLQHQLKL